MPLRDEYRDGDRIEDTSGNVAYVRACVSKDKRPYLRAIVVSGPRKDQWEWPERLGPPLLDWDKDGVATICHECDRRFGGGCEAGGAPYIFCRTCQKKDERAAGQRARDAYPGHGFGSNRPRVRRG